MSLNHTNEESKMISDSQGLKGNNNTQKRVQKKIMKQQYQRQPNLMLLI